MIGNCQLHGRGPNSYYMRLAQFLADRERIVMKTVAYAGARSGATRPSSHIVEALLIHYADAEITEIKV